MRNPYKPNMRNQLTGYTNFILLELVVSVCLHWQRYFKANGKDVSGYDRTKSELTEALLNEGCHIHFEDYGEKVKNYVSTKEKTLVIYTPAVSDAHKELLYLKEKGYTIYKRAEALGLITRFMKGLCVAGTHGKTTTSAMLSHILDQSTWKCNAFLGGIASNTNSNLLLNEQSEWVVVEADEFDRSFLYLSPFASIVTAMDPDHLDVYGDTSSFKDGFRQYSMKIDPNGVCIVKEGISLPTLCPSVSYGIDSDTADYNAFNLLCRWRNAIFCRY